MITFHWTVLGCIAGTALIFWIQHRLYDDLLVRLDILEKEHRDTIKRGLELTERLGPMLDALLAKEEE